MAKTYVLDSFAVLALLGKEEGSGVVADLLQQTRADEIRTLMTWVNVGEVAYIVERLWRTGQVFQVLGTLEATKIDIIPIERSLALASSLHQGGASIGLCGCLCCGPGNGREGHPGDRRPGFRVAGQGSFDPMDNRIEMREVLSRRDE